MHALFLAISLATAPPATAASVSELTLLYPDFNRIHYRTSGHRIGWTQVKNWPQREGWRAALVERLAGEGETAPRTYEVALLDGVKVVARHVGFAGHVSPGEISTGPRMVALDLGAFELRPKEFAVGVKTEQDRSKTLHLFRISGEALLPTLSILMESPLAGGGFRRTTLTLVRKKGVPDAYADILARHFEVKDEDSGAAVAKPLGETRYVMGEAGYVERQAPKTAGAER
ncbi:MAG: hypothetical protein ACKVPX_00075 [Myxococcaceae bacterium]